MKFRLTIYKESFDILKDNMKDKISFIKEETEFTILGNTNWIEFDIEVDNELDILNIFHSGVIAGSKQILKSLNKSV